MTLTPDGALTYGEPSSIEMSVLRKPLEVCRNWLKSQRGVFTIVMAGGEDAPVAAIRATVYQPVWHTTHPSQDMGDFRFVLETYVQKAIPVWISWVQAKTTILREIDDAAIPISCHATRNRCQLEESAMAQRRSQTSG